MSQTNQCPECGKPLPASVPSGLCPACLLKRGLESNTVGYTAEAPTGPSARWVPPSVEELAARFPELEIAGLIGRGGMGAVYQARQKNLERIVALKILPPEMGHDPAFAARFAREAQAMARLNHPHIVTIHEFGDRAGLYFFIMEYVDGVSLRGLLDSGHIAPKEALAIVPQICEALQYAHDQGIVHRDIKPENILINKQGQVKIADFGLAKLMGRAAGNTGTTEKVMGTPQYMAPEQISHPSDVDHRADIYSLGVVFYQMLTGELPTATFAPPSRKVVIDVRLDEVVLRAMEKEPEKRYQQVSQVKTEVETIAHTSTGASPEATPTRSTNIGINLEWERGNRPPFKGHVNNTLHVVNVRDGKAFYNWPGLLAYSLLASVVAVAIVLFCLAIGQPDRQRMPYMAPLMGFIVVAVLVRHRIRRELRMAAEQLGQRPTQVPPPLKPARAVIGYCLNMLPWLTILVLLYNRIPHFRSIFNDFHVALPSLTVLVLALSHWVQTNLGMLAIPLIFLIPLPVLLLDLIRPDLHRPALRRGYRLVTLATAFFMMVVIVIGIELPFSSLIEKLVDKPATTANAAAVVSQPATTPVVEAAVPQDAGPTVTGLPPVVVRTEPASGTRDVAPGITDIHVTFSKAMLDGSWSWCRAWDDSTPAIIGQPRYEADHHTATIKVKLEPGKTYACWINSENTQNFTDTSAHPAVPYLLIFQTRATTKE